MISLFIASLIILITCFIIGHIALSVISSEHNFFYKYLFGFVICSTIFTSLSIISPINYLSLVILFLISVIYLILRRSIIIDIGRKIKKNINTYPYLYGTFAVIIIILFSHSLYSPQLHYDAGLYHIQTIKWINQYPAVPGLANLHYRFGFNSNIYPFFAASTFEKVFGQPVYALNFISLFVFILWIFSKIQLHLLKSEPNKLLAYTILLVISIITYMPWISAPCTDICVFIFSAFVIFNLTEKEHQNKKYLLIPLGIFAITIKISVLPIALFLALIVVNKHSLRIPNNLIAITILSIIIVIPWIIRFVILTGWLAFPLSSIDLFSFDWKVPVENVQNLENIIHNYPRYIPIDTPLEERTLSMWFPIWLKNQSLIDLILLSATVLSIPLIIIIATLRKNTVDSQLLILYLLSVIGVLFWFNLSPRVRFGMPFIVASVLIPLFQINIKPSFTKVILIMGIFSVILFLYNHWFHPWHFLKKLNNYWLYPTKVEKVSNGNEIQYNYYLIDNNVKCFYPENDELCFDHELPCSINKIKDIHLRSTELKDGFYIRKLKDNRPTTK